jgi:DNA-binding SARP family transcriptional activator
MRNCAYRDVSGMSEYNDDASAPDLEVLGPLAVWRHGARLWLGPGQQRSVLGLLAINHGVTLHRDSIIDALWGDRPPTTAVTMVQSYVSRLRRLLRADRRAVCTLETIGAAYRLQAGDEFDLQCFTGAVNQAVAAQRAGTRRPPVNCASRHWGGGRVTHWPTSRSCGTISRCRRSGSGGPP